jgi:hypothetical protein
MADDLTKERLLAKLLDSKRPVSPRQLERWWKAGHMERPERRHVAGFRGSLSVFPARAYDQAAALYDATRPYSDDVMTDRRLDEGAFLSWWSGRPVAVDPRGLLLDFAAPILNAIDAVRAYEGVTIVDPQPDGDDEAIFNACERYFQDHPPDQFKTRLFRAFFRNLGRRSDDMLSVMLTMATSALGAMPILAPSSHTDEPSLAALVLKGFGFAEFQSEDSPETQVYNVLKNVALFADRKRVTDFVFSLTDDELANARRCTRAFLEELPAIFECQNILLGKKATARVLRAFVSMLKAEVKASTVIGMAWILGQGFSGNALRLVEQIEEGAPKARGLCAAVRAFPKDRDLFLSKNLSKLAALPEEKKQEILAVLKSAMA